MTEPAPADLTRTGPLAGVRVVELSGIGPAPFAGMLLADLGAEVICIERPGGNPNGAIGHRTLRRSRRHIAVDLRHPDAADLVLDLLAGADVLIEGFRPGVAERLGVGPEAALARNPALVYGRMTGWGQDGPWATAAGHDLNYIAVTGALHAIGEPGRKPVAPLNLVGDFGGGGMLLALGVASALVHARATGEGQVVDAAMVDGASLLMQSFFSFRAEGWMSPARGTNLLDGGAPFYDTYETADGGWIALGPIEPQFWAELRERMGLDDPVFADHMDRESWPRQRELLAEAVARRTRAEWEALLGGTDVCFAPVLDLEEAPAHPHLQARGTHVEVDGLVQAAPAPRFSGTPLGQPTGPRSPGAHTRQVLADLGVDPDRIEALVTGGAVDQD